VGRKETEGGWKGESIGVDACVATHSCACLCVEGVKHTRADARICSCVWGKGIGTVKRTHANALMPLTTSLTWLAYGLLKCTCVCVCVCACGRGWRTVRSQLQHMSSPI
jgi:hypothetical protein